MASFVFQGTATNHHDLLDKVVAHLTGAGMGTQAWTQMKYASGLPNWQDYYLKGPGLSGTDSIYVNMASWADTANDTYSLAIRGAINFNALNTFDGQPGSSGDVIVPLWDSTIPYWLVANGRRFIIIAKISTVYTSAYAGFLMPYATSSEMPYPLVVMGNCDGARRWSRDDYFIGGFWDPTEGAAFARHWDGAWVEVANYYARTDGRIAKGDNMVWPFNEARNVGRNRDGSYGLLPAILTCNYSSNNVYGELEGVYQVSGFSTASEDTITIGSDTFLIVQSANRTAWRDYAAIKLG